MLSIAATKHIKCKFDKARYLQEPQPQQEQQMHQKATSYNSASGTTCDSIPNLEIERMIMLNETWYISKLYNEFEVLDI